MKKLFFLICVIALAVTALASCTQDCEHPLSEAWESDYNGHWHPTTCEHGEMRSESEGHVDANEDGVCDLCRDGEKTSILDNIIQSVIGGEASGEGGDLLTTVLSNPYILGGGGGGVLLLVVIIVIINRVRG